MWKTKINWNNWSNKLQIRCVLYYFDYNWPRWPLKLVFLQGWLGPTTIGDLPPAERFSNNLNISNQRQPDISAQNEKSDFPVVSRTLSSCQEKHLSFHFLAKQEQSKSHQASDALRHQRCIKCTWDAKIRVFCAIFWQIFTAANGWMPTVKNPTAVNSRSQNEKVNMLKLPPNQAASGLPISFYTGDFSS